MPPVTGRHDISTVQDKGGNPVKRKTVLLFFATMLILSCTRSWQYVSLESLVTPETSPSAEACKNCHAEQYKTWKENGHGDAAKMGIIGIEALRQCGACHENTTGHAEDPEAVRPTNPEDMSRTGQNMVCGKCHYNQELFGSNAINPHDRHGLFMSVGFEGKKKQISCLDCHSGHRGGSEMLVTLKAHICYRCHKAAIITMGIFQPLNYITFGKACQACHSVHGSSAGRQWVRMGTGVCIICHFAGIAIVK